MEYEAMMEVVWKRVVGKGVHFVLIERGFSVKWGLFLLRVGSGM